MTDIQKEFLHQYMIEQKNYDVISKNLNVPRTTLSQWYEELKNVRIEIAEIRKLWVRKKIEAQFSEFYDWYLLAEKKCTYCHITEEEISNLLANNKLETKRIATRGRRLELDRKEPNSSYNDLNNIVLACYWCNNAKTDSFSHAEFLKVGEVFKMIWQNRLSQ